MILPAFVDLAEDLGQPEENQEAYEGPCRVELALESGELRRTWAGVVIVVQAFPEVMSALADERLVEQEHVQRDDKGYDHRGHRRSDPVVY